MCRFFSVVQVFRNGGIDTYYSEFVDSHTQICEEHNLKETSQLGESLMVKIELVPRDPKDFRNLDQYQFMIDEKRVPAWCNEHRDKMERGAYNALRKILSEPLSIERCVELNVPYSGSQTTVNGSLDCGGYTGDLSVLKSVGGSLFCRGYTGDLSSLQSVGGDLDCRYYRGNLSSLKSVGGYLDCTGCTGDLSSLKSIGGSLFCTGYTRDLSALQSVGGDLDCRDYIHEEKLRKQLGGKA